MDVAVYIIKQEKKNIPLEYWQKEKLNYDRLYLDLLIRLLRDEWKEIEDHSRVDIFIDTFKTKKISKEIIRRSSLHLVVTLLSVNSSRLPGDLVTGTSKDLHSNSFS